MNLCIAVVSLWLAVGAAAQVQEEIRFQLIDGWAVVLEGTLAGVPHRKLMLDTGAVPSAINAKFARKVGLSGASSELSLMNRSITVERVRVPEVRLGSVSVRALDMVAVDLQRIEQALGTRIDAVIGFDFLAQQNFSLDYRHKKLIFGKGAALSGAIAFETEHEAGGTYVVIPMECDGEQVRVLLDTGTRDLMLFKGRLRGSLQHLHSRAQGFNLNAGGQDLLTEVEIPSVRAGPVFRKWQKAYVWTLAENQSRGFDGLLGPAAFGATTVGFDFDRRLLSFESQ
jgi:predicted aspartyl protease